jgi:hypothetical protein
LNFQKWTKKMSKIDIPKHFLLTKFSYSMLKNYGDNLNDNKKFYDDKFFIFLRKTILELFILSLYDSK